MPGTTKPAVTLSTSPGSTEGGDERAPLLPRTKAPGTELGSSPGSAGSSPGSDPSLLFSVSTPSTTPPAAASPTSASSASVPPLSSILSESSVPKGAGAPASSSFPPAVTPGSSSGVSTPSKLRLVLKEFFDFWFKYQELAGTYCGYLKQTDPRESPKFKSLRTQFKAFFERMHEGQQSLQLNSLSEAPEEVLISSIAECFKNKEALQTVMDNAAGCAALSWQLQAQVLQEKDITIQFNSLFSNTMWSYKNMIDQTAPFSMQLITRLEMLLSRIATEAERANIDARILNPLQGVCEGIKRLNAQGNEASNKNKLDGVRESLILPEGLKTWLLGTDAGRTRTRAEEMKYCQLWFLLHQAHAFTDQTSKEILAESAGWSACFADEKECRQLKERVYWGSIVSSTLRDRISREFPSAPEVNGKGFMRTTLDAINQLNGANTEAEVKTCLRYFKGWENLVKDADLVKKIKDENIASVGQDWVDLPPGRGIGSASGTTTATPGSAAITADITAPDPLGEAQRNLLNKLIGIIEEISAYQIILRQLGISTYYIISSPDLTEAQRSHLLAIREWILVLVDSFKKLHTPNFWIYEKVAQIKNMDLEKADQAVCREIETFLNPENLEFLFNCHRYFAGIYQDLLHVSLTPGALIPDVLRDTHLALGGREGGEFPSLTSLITRFFSTATNLDILFSDALNELGKVPPAAGSASTSAAKKPLRIVLEERHQVVKKWSQRFYDDFDKYLSAFRRDVIDRSFPKGPFANWLKERAACFGAEEWEKILSHGTKIQEKLSDSGRGATSGLSAANIVKMFSSFEIYITESAATRLKHFYFLEQIKDVEIREGLTIGQYLAEHPGITIKSTQKGSTQELIAKVLDPNRRETLETLLPQLGLPTPSKMVPATPLSAIETKPVTSVLKRREQAMLSALERHNFQEICNGQKQDWNDFFTQFVDTLNAKPTADLEKFLSMVHEAVLDRKSVKLTDVAEWGTVRVYPKRERGQENADDYVDAFGYGILMTRAVSVALNRKYSEDAGKLKTATDELKKVLNWFYSNIRDTNYEQASALCDDLRQVLSELLYKHCDGQTITDSQKRAKGLGFLTDLLLTKSKFDEHGNAESVWSLYEDDAVSWTTPMAVPDGLPSSWPVGQQGKNWLTDIQTEYGSEVIGLFSDHLQDFSKQATTSRYRNIPNLGNACHTGNVIFDAGTLAVKHSDYHLQAGIPQPYSMKNPAERKKAAKENVLAEIYSCAETAMIEYCAFWHKDLDRLAEENSANERCIKIPILLISLIGISDNFQRGNWSLLSSKAEGVQYARDFFQDNKLYLDRQQGVVVLNPPAPLSPERFLRIELDMLDVNDCVNWSKIFTKKRTCDFEDSMKLVSHAERHLQVLSHKLPPKERDNFYTIRRFLLSPATNLDAKVKKAMDDLVKYLITKQETNYAQMILDAVELKCINFKYKNTHWNSRYKADAELSLTHTMKGGTAGGCLSAADRANDKQETVSARNRSFVKEGKVPSHTDTDKERKSFSKEYSSTQTTHDRNRSILGSSSTMEGGDFTDCETAAEKKKSKEGCERIRHSRYESFWFRLFNKMPTLVACLKKVNPEPSISTRLKNATSSSDVEMQPLLTPRPAAPLPTSSASSSSSSSSSGALNTAGITEALADNQNVRLERQQTLLATPILSVTRNTGVGNANKRQSTQQGGCWGWLFSSNKYQALASEEDIRRAESSGTKPKQLSCGQRTRVAVQRGDGDIAPANRRESTELYSPM